MRSPRRACQPTLVFAVLFLGAVALAQGQIIQNGSFENNYTGWTASGHQGIAQNDPNHPATDGIKVVVLNPNDQFSNALLSQTFATTPGQRYELSFDYGCVGPISDQRLQVTLEGNGILLDQTIEIAGPTTEVFYVPQRITFTANSTNTKLTFADAGYTYVFIDSMLDNVQVVPVASGAPLITAQPQRTAVANGTNATFNVTASGATSYQWKFNGVDIPTATGSSYTVTSADSNDAGNYSVVVTNGSGFTTSSAATLTVLPQAILLNGSFEYGSARWTFTGASTSTSTNSTGYGTTDGVVLSHFNWGQATPGGSISQTFQTIPGTGYVLRFDYGAFGFQTTAEQRIQVTAQGTGTLVSQTLSVFGVGSGHIYQPAMLQFVANSNTTTLTFLDVSPSTINIDLLLDNVSVTLQGAPSIVTQPKSAAAQVGGSASFSVSASGQAPLSYQWRFNGQDIPGANSTTYTINSVQNGDAGDYDVVVSNSIDSVVSSTVTLSIIPPGTPTNGSFEYDFAAWNATGNQDIVTPAGGFPASDGNKAVAFNAGQRTPNGVLTQTIPTIAGVMYTLNFDMGVYSYQSTALMRFLVTAQGNNPLLSQTVSIAGQGTGSRYEARSLTFVADSGNTILSFQDTSTATTNIDVLLDNVRLISQNAPNITAQPQNAAVQAGDSATFNVTASGQPPLSYQWRFNGQNIPDANSNSYTINNVQNSDVGGYDVVVSNSADSTTSNTATLSLLPPGTPSNGSFEYDYAAWTATGNQNIVVPAGGFPVSDGNKAVAFNSGQQTPNGVLTQTIPTIAGVMYTLNFDIGVFSYQSTALMRFLVTAQGNSNLLSQTVSIAGQGTGGRYEARTLTFVADSSNTILRFQDTSTATTNIDLLLDNVRLISQGAPSITAQPQSTAVQAGDSATFSVTAAGQAPLSYQWRFNGQNIPSANSSSYTINNVQNGNTGDYDVVVSNSVDSVTSATATLTLLPPGIPSNGSFEYDYAAWTATGNQNIVVPAGGFPVSDGNKAVAFNSGQAAPNAVLSQSIPTTAGVTYTVNFDMGVYSYQSTALMRFLVTAQGNNLLMSQTVSIAGQGTGSRYEARSLTFVADSSNTLLTFQDTSTATTNIDLLLDYVRVTPQNAPTITSQPQNATAPSGSNVTFSVTAAGQPPLSYQWRFNGQDIPSANSSSYTINNVQNGDAGDYDVVVSNSISSVTSSTASLTIIPPGTPLNGSFEYDFAAWNATGNQDIVTSASGFPVSAGNKAVAFNNGQRTPNGVLLQSFSTTIGATYVLTFDMGVFSYQSFGEERLQVTAQGTNLLLTQSVSMFGQGTGSRYETKTYSFVADSNTTTLRFQDTSLATTNIDLLLDNVNVALQGGPTISAQPQSTAAEVGGSATFSVTASGQAPLSYQWRFNGQDIPSANSSSYTINNVQNGDAGDYDVVVSNSVDSVTSATATLTLLPSGTPTNGSFEYDFAAWTATGNQDIVTPAGGYPVSHGSKAVAFNTGQRTPNAVLSQSIPTTAGVTYTLNFDMGVYSYQSTALMRFLVTAQGNNPLLSQTVSIAGQGTGSRYEARSLSFVADSSNTILTFQDTSTATTNIDLLLDNVQVVAQ